MSKATGIYAANARWHIRKLNQEMDKFLASGDLSDQTQETKHNGNWWRRQKLEDGLKLMDNAAEDLSWGPGKEFEHN
jgi:hypothetical protein